MFLNIDNPWEHKYRIGCKLRKLDRKESWFQNHIIFYTLTFQSCISLFTWIIWLLGIQKIIYKLKEHFVYWWLKRNKGNLLCREFVEIDQLWIIGLYTRAMVTRERIMVLMRILIWLLKCSVVLSGFDTIWDESCGKSIKWSLNWE